MMEPMMVFWLKLLKTDESRELRGEAVSLYEDEPAYLVQLSTALFEVTVYTLMVRSPPEGVTERHGEKDGVRHEEKRGERHEEKHERQRKKWRVTQRGTRIGDMEGETGKEM